MRTRRLGQSTYMLSGAVPAANAAEKIDGSPRLVSSSAGRFDSAAAEFDAGQVLGASAQPTITPPATPTASTPQNGEQ
jgi:hypothetical protein